MKRLFMYAIVLTALCGLFSCDDFLFPDQEQHNNPPSATDFKRYAWFSNQYGDNEPTSFDRLYWPFDYKPSNTNYCHNITGRFYCLVYALPDTLLGYSYPDLKRIKKVLLLLIQFYVNNRTASSK